MLKANGYENIAVMVKEAAVYDQNGGSASIDADGTIHYYFNPDMSGRGGVYFDTTFLLSCNGSSVEKVWTTHMNWDEAKAQEALRAELNRIQLPAVIEENDLGSCYLDLFLQCHNCRNASGISVLCSLSSYRPAGK